MRNKSLKINTIFNAVRMLLTVLVPLITFPYTSRIFQTDGSGEISFVQSVVQIFTLFASLGIYGYGLREGAKVRNDKQKFSKLALELFIINLTATILTYIIFIIMINTYTPFSALKELFLVHGLAIGFTALGLDWVFGAYEDYMYITIRQIVLQIFVVIAMLVFIHSKEDIFIWMTILTVSSVGSNIFNFIYARRFISFSKRTKLEIKRHIKPILILFATALASRTYLNLDTLLLGIQTTAHNVGVYSAAVKMNTVLITMFSAMSPVFMPRLIDDMAKQDKNAYYLLMTKIFRLILSMCIPVVIGLEMVSKELIYILAGAAFSDAVVTMRILVPIVLVCSCTNILYYNVLVPSGKEDCVLKCTIIGSAVNFIISVLLIPNMKENGAAIGSLISELTALKMAFGYCKKVDGEIMKTIPSVFNYILGGIGIVLCCGFVHILSQNDIVTLTACVVLSIIVYFGIIYIRKDEMVTEGIGVLKSFTHRLKKR